LFGCQRFFIGVLVLRFSNGFYICCRFHGAYYLYQSLRLISNYFLYPRHWCWIVWLKRVFDDCCVFIKVVVGMCWRPVHSSSWNVKARTTFFLFLLFGFTLVHWVRWISTCDWCVCMFILVYVEYALKSHNISFADFYL
jgi:hypothetical protein